MTDVNWTQEMEKNWVDMQKQYWDVWGNMVKASSAQPESEMNMPPWGKTLEDWWNNSSQATPADVNDVMSRITDMGRMYMSMAEMMHQSSELYAAQPQKKEPLDLWMSMMEKGFSDWAKQIAMGNVPDSAVGVGPMHSDGWLKVLKSLGMDMMPNMGAFGASSSQGWQDQLRKMLSTPGVGYSRESQEQLQVLAKLMQDYQECLKKYLGIFSIQGTDSIQALRAYMKKLSKEEQEVTTLRELFDTWVNVNEKQYAEFVLSLQYQAVYGNMVNAFMRLKSAMNEQVERLYKAANLPTRSEFNAALQKQQFLKRENRALRKTLKVVMSRLDDLETTIYNDGEVALSHKKSSAGQDKETSEDDLTKIKGLGPKMSEKLYDMGIKSFTGLSELSLDTLHDFDKSLGSQGRLLRDDWVGQAKSFVEKSKP
ncbi:MAG: Poly(R)-hydroxyalkanoic acid synthase, class III, PhaE subunit [uncultured Thiotrichaceae bacterium]|uniref:Poly(3-hydroxyalkanoate) polymerase subunit PhaE n=1 Tax=uncultured Thiotrichaceae bacterium TaxID=298394 RepID=A0A6S6SC50_9GAMM|nr:MAG: Poly(R)-hydroxyalkanoic acid synthase, class III, PhaE subunit [uncultured Thiotrichaceae bacterium]